MKSTLSINDVSRILYILCMTIVPFYFGGERLLSWVAAAVLQALVMLVSTFSETREPERLIYIRSSFRNSILLVLAVIVWALFQSLSFPQNPFAHPVWALSNGALSIENYAAISVAPDESVLTMFKFVIVGQAYMNGYKLFNRPSWATRLMKLQIGIGTIYAAIGLYAYYAFQDQHIWLDRNPYQGVLVSTFVNRNTFAMYLSLNLILCLVIIVNTNDGYPSRFALRQKLMSNLTEKLSIHFILFGAYIILMTALILTASRAGIAFALIGQASVIFIHALRTREYNFLSFFLVFGLIAVAAFLFSKYSLHVDVRSMEIDSNYQDRISLYKQVWAAIQERPLIGYGLGTFENVFRYHKSIDFDPVGIWLRAHNAYLEAMLGLGIPASLILLVACIIPISAILRASRDFRLHAPALAAIAMVLSVALHSLFDFGIQAASNAMLVFGMLGVALGTQHNLPNHQNARKLI